jgi:hypothetical protein
MANKLVTGIASVLVVGAVCVVTAGCAGAPPDDRPVVRIMEAARPSTAIPLGQFLPDAAELSATLGTGANGFMGQLVQGDAGMLLQSVSDAQVTPPDCVSAAYRLQKIAYDGARVQSVASTSWTGGDFGAAPVSGFFGVVQLPSVANAQTFFATVTDEWRRCNGQGVALRQPAPGADELSRITDVAFDRRVVSASVLHAAGGSGSPTFRALGVAGDCIVDVEIIDPRAAGGAQPAVDVSQLMLDKITAQR